MNIQPLIDRWQTDEGKPYKGTLIDMDAYNADPSNPGCMCAQGQVLHHAGWEGHRLIRVPQDEADREVAKLLNISNAHAILLRIVNDRTDGAPAVVLTDPGAVLGNQWSKVLDFWWYLDAMTEAAWEAVWRLELVASRRAARRAAREAAGAAAREDAWVTAGAAAWKAGWEYTEEVAWEIQGAEIMRRDGKPFYFLPIFGFAAPDDIPARPVDYGPFTGE
jgi:hypothetical protein